MNESIPSSVAHAAATQAFCSACGTPVEPTSVFCGGCGQRLPQVPEGGRADDPVPASGGPEGAPSGMPPLGNAPPPRPGAGWQTNTGPPNTPPPPHVYTGGYPALPQPPRRTPWGLIGGLCLAGLVAVGAIIGIIALAQGGDGAGPQLTVATNAAAAVAPAQPGSSAAAATTPAPGGSADSLVPTASTSTPAAVTSTSTPAPPSGPSAADMASAQQVIERHWAFINSGNFPAAFALFVPGTQGSESSWVAAHEQEAPISASVRVGVPTFLSSTEATVPLLSLNTNSSDGCANWTGSYDVRKENGQWLINQANLQKQPC